MSTWHALKEIAEHVRVEERVTDHAIRRWIDLVSPDSTEDEARWTLAEVALKGPLVEASTHAGVTQRIHLGATRGDDGAFVVVRAKDVATSGVWRYEEDVVAVGVRRYEEVGSHAVLARRTLFGWEPSAEETKVVLYRAVELHGRLEPGTNVCENTRYALSRAMGMIANDEHLCPDPEAADHAYVDYVFRAILRAAR